MSKKVNDGGSAYPYGQISEVTGQPINGCFSGGMSLRDYFIGQAIAGIDLEEWLDRVESDESCDSSKAYGMIAKHCMGVADAIIAAKEEEEKTEGDPDDSD